MIIMILSVYAILVQGQELIADYANVYINYPYNYCPDVTDSVSTNNSVWSSCSEHCEL